MILWGIAKVLDKCLDVSPGLLEDHTTNGPIVGISVSILRKEVVRENTSCRCVPWVTCSPQEMESKYVSSTTLSELWVPVCHILVRNSIFEPIVVTD